MMEVMAVQDSIENAELAIVCAILHDTIEDTVVTYSELEKEFGEAVANGVMALSKDELEILEIEKSKKIIQKEYKIRQERSISLQEYFNNIITKDDRNKAILKALDDGYRQSEIAKYLNISCATVSKIFRSVK